MVVHNKMDNDQDILLTGMGNLLEIGKIGSCIVITSNHSEGNINKDVRRDITDMRNSEIIIFNLKILYSYMAFRHL